MCPGRENKIKKDARRGPIPPAVSGFALLYALCLLCAMPMRAAGAVLEGRVVAVADGDTITVLGAGRVRERIRLAGIDAPESRQAFGKAAKQRLAALVFGAEVRVAYRKRDRYGRIVGRVTRARSDAGLALIESGHAWHYRRYASEQAPADRAAYAQAERAARADRRGLWAAAAPVAPWDWRRARRRLAAERRARAVSSSASR